MDEAQALILEKGFGSATVDSIIEQAGVSKGAFFHYFSNKNELGHALVQRYAREDLDQLDETLARAERLSDDPLQQLLIFVKLFEEHAESLEEPYPGCLFASYLHQSGLFDEEILDIIRQWMLTWRSRLADKLQEVVQKHPPARQIDIESLADELLVTFEGAFVLSQSLKDPQVVARQLSHYHTYLQLLFNNEK